MRKEWYEAIETQKTVNGRASKINRSCFFGKCFKKAHWLRLSPCYSRMAVREYDDVFTIEQLICESRMIYALEEAYVRSHLHHSGGPHYIPDIH